MRTLALEIRDRGTFVPMVAVKMTSENEAEGYLLRRSGFSDTNPLILLTRMGGGEASYDPYSWGDRTFHVAHKYIQEHFDELNDGDVVDVEYILCETGVCKLSEKSLA